MLYFYSIYNFFLDTYFTFLFIGGLIRKTKMGVVECYHIIICVYICIYSIGTYIYMIEVDVANNYGA